MNENVTDPPAGPLAKLFAPATVGRCYTLPGQLADAELVSVQVHGVPLDTLREIAAEYAAEVRHIACDGRPFDTTVFEVEGVRVHLYGHPGEDDDLRTTVATQVPA